MDEFLEMLGERDTAENTTWNRDVILGYGAAAIDGEGCVTIKKEYHRYKPYVEIGQNSNGYALLMFMQCHFRGTLSSEFPQPGNRKPKRLVFWIGDAAYNLLKTLQPFMLVKAPQANLAIAYHERFMEEKAKCFQVWKGGFGEEAQRYFQQMRVLNKKGIVEDTPTDG